GGLQRRRRETAVTDGDRGQRTWAGDWRARLLARLHAQGLDTVAAFLARHPGEPYVRVARRLGDDVAAMQLMLLQFEEAEDADRLRRAAMDGLARELADCLRRGWGRGMHVKFNAARAYAGFLGLV